MKNKQGTLAAIEADFDTILDPASIKGAMKAAGAGSRDLWQIPPQNLRVIDGFNPRVMNAEYEAHIRAIADSMLTEGYLQEYPLAGYAAKVDGEPVLFVYSGHTRLLAVALANKEGAEIQHVPVSVNQSGLSMEDMTVGLIRGNSGKPLSYFESAVVCKRLVKYGFDVKDISKRTGISVPLVNNRLALMASPLKLREMVANGVVSATLVIDMINQHGSKALEAIEAAQERTEDAGKTRVTKAQTVAKPAAERTERFKFVKKSAPRLYEAAESVRKDPGYSALSSETRELLESLLAQIQGKPDGGAQTGAAPAA